MKPEPSLDIVQQWFQAVVTHPEGVAAGGTKFCMNCGKTMPKPAKFCPECGGAQQ